MPASIRLGRILGIPIGLHYSWFIIAALIVFSLAGHFQATHADWPQTRVWIVALLTAALFFASLVAHELSHSAVAKARGLPVRSITLFALGGVASIDKEASSAKTEFLIAIVGPLVSFAIGGICLALAGTLGWALDDGTAGVTGSVLGWLGSINVLLAVFNLIPGYPLDGGRILRAALWAVYDDGQRATRTASRVGQIVAAIFIGWGLLQFFTGAGIGGLWLAFIGWFLMTAAQASYQQVSLREALRDVRVADVMANDCASVNSAMPVSDLVNDVLLRTGRRCVVVKSGERVVGLVTPREIGEIDRRHWGDTTAAQVMRPLQKLSTVPPTVLVADALETMSREAVNQLPVVCDGRLAGIISRAQILQLLQSRAELRAP